MEVVPCLDAWPPPPARRRCRHGMASRGAGSGKPVAANAQEEVPLQAARSAVFPVCVMGRAEAVQP